MDQLAFHRRLFDPLVLHAQCDSEPEPIALSLQEERRLIASTQPSSNPLDNSNEEVSPASSAKIRSSSEVNRMATLSGFITRRLFNVANSKAITNNRNATMSRLPQTSPLSIHIDQIPNSPGFPSQTVPRPCPKKVITSGNRDISIASSILQVKSSCSRDWARNVTTGKDSSIGIPKVRSGASRTENKDKMNTGIATTNAALAALYLPENNAAKTQV